MTPLILSKSLRQDGDKLMTTALIEHLKASHPRPPRHYRSPHNARWATGGRCTAKRWSVHNS